MVQPLPQPPLSQRMPMFSQKPTRPFLPKPFQRRRTARQRSRSSIRLLLPSTVKHIPIQRQLTEMLARTAIPILLREKLLPKAVLTAAFTPQRLLWMQMRRTSIPAQLLPLQTSLIQTTGKEKSQLIFPMSIM